jgi:hypothetical protein
MYDCRTGPLEPEFVNVSGAQESITSLAESIPELYVYKYGLGLHRLVESHFWAP